MNDAGDMFDVERLQALLAAAQTHDVDAVLARIEEQVAAFRGETEPFDDATMMALRITDQTD